MEKSVPSASATAKTSEDRRRRGEIIQPEFSGLRAIPLDSFDVFSSALAPPSFLPYFIPSSVRVAAPMQIRAYRFETGWKYQTGIATQLKLLHFLPRFPSRCLSRVFLSLKKKIIVFSRYLIAWDNNNNMLRNKFDSRETDVHYKLFMRFKIFFSVIFIL